MSKRVISPSEILLLKGRKVYVVPEKVRNCGNPDYMRASGKIGVVTHLHGNGCIDVKFPDGTTMLGAAAFRFLLVLTKLEQALL